MQTSSVDTSRDKTERRDASRGDMNPDTGLPHSVSLGEVLADIELTPGEASAFLAWLAGHFDGGAHADMGHAIRDRAAEITNIETYGAKPADNKPVNQAELLDRAAARQRRLDAGAQGQSQPFASIGEHRTPSETQFADNDAQRSRGTVAGDVQVSPDRADDADYETWRRERDAARLNPDDAARAEAKERADRERVERDTRAYDPDASRRNDPPRAYDPNNPKPVDPQNRDWPPRDPNAAP